MSSADRNVLPDLPPVQEGANRTPPRPSTAPIRESSPPPLGAPTSSRNPDERPSSSRSNTRSILLSPSNPIPPLPGQGPAEGVQLVPSSPVRDVDIPALRLRDTRTEFALPNTRVTSASHPLPLPPHNRSPGGSVVEDADDTRTLSVQGQEMGYHPVNLPPGEVPSTGSRRRPQRSGTYASRRSELEWREKPILAQTVGGRLQMTIEEAEAARDRYAVKARWSGYCLNAAIGLQVLLGSLTTGLSAVATSGRSAAVQTTILGGLSTIVASYLARARGSGEPESSNSRLKALDGFLRRVRNFSTDYGHITGTEHDARIEEFRKELEYLLGTTSGNTER